MFRFAAVAMVVGILSGCATSNAIYTPPERVEVNNTMLVPQDFDTVWDRLVRQLSSDFFVINNIDKGSRLINISFSTQTPSRYVDCGNTERTFSNVRGTQNYNYKSADSSSFISTNNMGQATNFTRRTKLEGRSNIYVAPEGNSSTQVVVNTKYVLGVDILGVGLGRDTFTLDFSTKEGGSTEDGLLCFSNGKIEKQIIEFALP